MTQSIHRPDLEREADIKFEVPIQDIMAHFPGHVVANPSPLFADMIRSRMKAMGDNKRVALATHSVSNYGLSVTVRAWIEDE